MSKKKTPKEPQLGLSLPRWFAPSSPVEPETSTAKDLPSGLEIKSETKPVTQEETQRPEPSDNMPGEYAYKKTGVDKGDVMRPDLKKGKNK